MQVTRVHCRSAASFPSRCKPVRGSVCIVRGPWLCLYRNENSMRANPTRRAWINHGRKYAFLSYVFPVKLKSVNFERGSLDGNDCYALRSARTALCVPIAIFFDVVANRTITEGLIETTVHWHRRELYTCEYCSFLDFVCVFRLLEIPQRWNESDSFKDCNF